MVNPQSIKLYLDNSNLIQGINDKGYIVDCPICGREKHAFIYSDYGNWNCRGCDSRGNWVDFTSKINVKPQEKQKIQINNEIINKWKLNLESNLEGRKYLEQRKIPTEILNKFNIGITEWGDITTPHYKNGYLKIVQFKHFVGEKRFYYSEGEIVPFNYDCVDDYTDELLLVEGAMDALASITYGNTKVWGVPGCQQWNSQWTEKLKKVKKIYIAYDIGDKESQGDRGAYKLTEILGFNRCYRVTLPLHDLNDCLKNDVPISVIINAMKTAKQIEVSGVSNREQLLEGAIELAHNDGEIVGASTGYTKIDKILLGLRPGEFTLVAGYDNVGKTTILSSFALNLVKQQLPIFFFSFETHPKKLLMELLTSWQGRSLKTSTSEEIRELGRKFINDYPLHLWDITKEMKFSTIPLLREYIKFLKDRYDIKYIIIDALANLILSSKKKVTDSVRGDDEYLNGLGNLTRELGVHILGTVHLKKDTGSTEKVKMPSKSDIKGTSGSAYFSDNILIIHRDMDYTADSSVRQELMVGVAKNRYSGELGYVHLFYDRNTKTYTEV